MSFCPSCGRGVVAGTQFCAACGASLQGPVAPHPAATPPGYAPQPTIAARVRPTGVAILAVLQWLGAIALALFGLVGVLGGSAFAGAMGGFDNAFTDFFGGAIGMLFVLFGVLLLAGAALCLLLGIGLWKGKAWARILSLVFAWFGLVSGALGAIGTMVEDPTVGIVQILFTGIYAFLIWYWTRPGVKAFFASTAPIQ